MARRLVHNLSAAALLAALLAASPAHATLERAQAAQARGDLRAAQIELRNAVRTAPNDGALRAALAAASLDVGDGDTAEKEARAALERGFDQAQGTALVLRAYLALGRTRDLLRDFPVPNDPARAAVAGRIAAARALAQLALDDRAAARDSVAQAIALAPGAADPHLAAAVLAQAGGDRAAAEAAVDRALAADPTSSEATLRKASSLFQRGEPAAVADLLSPLLVRMPGSVAARVMRAEALMRLGRDADARQDVEAALRTQPGSASAYYLRGVLLGRAQDWRGADEVFQRLGASLNQFPDGYLLAATARRALGQNAQAEDLAQRHVARNPEDPRGVKLLAVMLLETNRPNDAAGVLTRLASRNAADAEALDLLGRAHIAARRPRDAVTALERAVALAPQDAGIRSRLAAARLSAGDIVGTAQAAEETLRLAPDLVAAREVLAATALARGDLAEAEAELDRLDPAARRLEVAGILEGTIRLGRVDLAGARSTFETVLRNFPESAGARLGLARVLGANGDLEGAERLWAEVLRRDASNAEALNRLAALVRAGGPRAGSARAALEAAQAASPSVPAPSLALATALASSGDLAGAARILEMEALRAPGRSASLPLLRMQVYGSLNRWPEAEVEARAALAEDPDSTVPRRLLAQIMVRDNRARDAETLLQDGMRRRPGDALLQQTLVGVVHQSRGIEPAFATVDRIGQMPGTQPAARSLRGEFLLSLQRPAEAAQSFAAAYAEAPSAMLALQLANAWRITGQPARAVAALEDWLRREPEHVGALEAMAQLDLAEGRHADAQRRLAMVVERMPTNAVALNNLAWSIASGGETAALLRAKGFAERAYFLLPSAETADTLGWIMARSGEPQRALTLLHQAATVSNASQRPDRGISFRLAFTLHAAGEREEALRTLEPALADASAFSERAEAERLMARLRSGG